MSNRVRWFLVIIMVVMPYGTGFIVAPAIFGGMYIVQTIRERRQHHTVITRSTA